MYIKATLNIEQRKHLKVQVFWDVTSRQAQHAGDADLYIDPCYSLKTRQEISVTGFERFNCTFLGPHRSYNSDLFRTFERCRLFIDLIPNTEIYLQTYILCPPQKKHNFMPTLASRQIPIFLGVPLRRSAFSNISKKKNDAWKMATRSSESHEPLTRISNSKF